MLPIFAGAFVALLMAALAVRPAHAQADASLPHADPAAVPLTSFHHLPSSVVGKSVAAPASAAGPASGSAIAVYGVAPEASRLSSGGDVDIGVSPLTGARPVVGDLRLVGSVSAPCRVRIRVSHDSALITFQFALGQSLTPQVGDCNFGVPVTGQR